MDRSEEQRTGRRDRAWTWFVIAALVFFRNADGFLYPILFGEDGTRLFMYYQLHREPSSLLREYAGYVSFAANAAGYLIGAFPLVAQPYLLAGGAGLLTVTTFWLFSSPRFSHVLPSPRLRCGLAVVWAAVPAGNAALVTATMFINWHLLLIACMQALARPPRSTWGRRAEFGFLWLCLWTNPVSIVLLPVFGWRAFRAQRDRQTALVRHYGGLAVLTVFYQLCFVTGGGGESSATTWGVLARSLHLFTNRICTESLVGFFGRAELHALHPALLWLTPVLIGLVIYRAWPRLPSGARAWTLACAGLIAITTLAVVVARFDGFRGMLHWGQRYSYVQRLLLYLVLTLAILHLARRPPLVLAALALHVLLLNVVDRQFYATSRPLGRQVQAFVARGAAWRNQPDSSADRLELRQATRTLTIYRNAAPPR